MVRALSHARGRKIDPGDEPREWQRLWRAGRPAFHLAAATVRDLGLGLRLERRGLASVTHQTDWVERALELAAIRRREVIEAGLADDHELADFRFPAGGFS